MIFMDVKMFRILVGKPNRRRYADQTVKPKTSKMGQQGRRYGDQTVKGNSDGMETKPYLYIYQRSLKKILNPVLIRCLNYIYLF